MTLRSRCVAECLVADEGDARDAGRRAFDDLEDEIHAAVVELDDLRRDGGLIAAAAAVELEDTLDVGLHAWSG